MFALLCVMFLAYSDQVVRITSEAKPQHAIKVRSLSEDSFQVFEYTNLSFTHAECPVWDAQAGTLYWVDVLNQNVHALEYKTKNHRIKHIDYGEVNVILPIANSSRSLVGVRTEVFLLDWNKPSDAALRLLAAVDMHHPDNILNEGKADARGRFWGGTKGPQRGDAVMPDEGALYSMEQPCFTPKVQLKPVSISNGLVWARNNSVLYYIDSDTRKIEAFDFDLDRGQISKRRTIIDISDYGFTEAIPDGMTIDRDGLLWVALMFDGSVIRIDPNAKIITEKYQLPVSRTSSVTWMGEYLEDLIVTTSRRNMDAATLAAEPLSGAIFILHRLGTGGVPDYKFRFDGADRY